MKVSIIIPAYNHGKYIEQAVISAVGQTYWNKEVIVVDDGSTDDSAEIVRSIDECWPVELIQQENVGQQHRSASHARNVGIVNSSGHLILPLDADDWIEPTFLAKTVPMMSDNVAIVSTDMHRFGVIDDVIRAERRTLEQELGSNTLPMTSLVRKSAILQVGGLWQYGWEDWDLWLKILEGGWKVDVVNEPLFHHRVSPGGLNDDQTNRRAELAEKMRAVHPGFVGV